MSEFYEAAAEIREALLERLPTEKERRRYALLNAASVVYGASYGAFRTNMDAVHRENDCRDSVAAAETLLAEIEKREAK